MKVAIELSVVTKKQRVRIGQIDMEINLTEAVELAMNESAKLTRRETQVRDALLLGLQNKEIAADLHLSTSTVKFHAASLYRKYGVNGRSELVYALSRAKKVDEKT